MRRLAFLIIGSAAFLLLAAVPVLADGGPHIASVNSGTTGISADSCAGCHRAHTAKGEMLLVQDEAALCLTCHGATGTGATTDVMDGIQYSVSTDPTKLRGTEILGALRAGGFEKARIGSGSAARLAYTSGTATRQLGAVPVLSAGQDVTSVHMDPLDTEAALGTAWGNGAVNSGAGGTAGMTCTTCHNPHGNGQYRILNPLPVANGGTMTAATVAANVTDAPLGTPDAQGNYPVRNYTVMQKKGTEGTPATYLLYANQISGVYANTVGDYFHRKVPWNATSGASKDAPNGLPSTFDTQINAWCSQCHTRYLAITGAPFQEPLTNGTTVDSTFTYRHSNTSDKPCTTCHVAHGSNAVMTGFYSTTKTMPDGTTAPTYTVTRADGTTFESADSRLLKIDNGGTCQACHDPTGTITAGTQLGTPVVVP